MRQSILRALGAGALCAVFAGCQESVAPLDISGQPAVVILVSGNNQADVPGKTLVQPLVVIVTDADGKPSPAVQIVWTVTGGTITPAIDSTDESGQSTAIWTLPGQPGNYVATATASGVGSVTFSAIATAPFTVVRTSVQFQVGTAGTLLAQPLVITVFDVAGRPFPNARVEWTVTGGTVTPPVDFTDEFGVSSVTWLLPPQPGRYTATATVSGAGSVIFNTEARPLGSPLVFRYLDAGSYHSCGIATNENLYCWGYNGDGQLGPGQPVGESFAFPNLIPDLESFRLVSGGRYHSCGVTLSGQVACWGKDKDGRLGDREFPPTFQYVQAGYVHTCGLSLSREIWCWGYNGEGELGDGLGAPGSFSATPLLVGNRFEVVTVNGLHSCGIKEDNVAMCWGFNAERQLGTGSLERFIAVPDSVRPVIAFRTDPTVVPPAPDPDFPLPIGPFIAAGYAHTCAISVAGPTYCWGLNENGQLGTGNRISSSAPAVVSSGVQFVRITSGQSHTCGLTAAGAAYCWGDNTFGQIGDGTKSTPGSDNNDRLVPTPVAGGLIFAYLKAGELHTCGVTTTGVAYCWGDNEYGQIGNGDIGEKKESLSPSKVAFQP